MTDCVDLLNQHLNDSSYHHTPQLLWLDENISAQELSLCLARKNLTIITNRFDDLSNLKNLGIHVEYSDFKADKLENHSYSRILYRISKERFVSHHCINMSTKLLTKSGKLVLIGRKEDGIKSYFDKCKKVLNAEGKIEKNKGVYAVELSFPNPTTDSLDDGNYRKIRKVADVDINNSAFQIHSKPGVYGWKKVDSGTSFLIHTLSSELEMKNLDKTSTLDLGCGSGHLSLALSAWGASSITATDNNATALLATTSTLTHNNVAATVIPTNAGDTISETFDLIVSNPPFHKGFDTNKNISEDFIKAVKRLLKRSGLAYFVTNAFVNIESPAKKHKLNVKQIANNKQFKVTEITHCS